MDVLPGEVRKGVTVDPPDRPLILGAGAERAVEAVGVDVPVEHPPLEAGPASIDG